MSREDAPTNEELLRVAKAALADISQPFECGCVPCRGQCRSQAALEATLLEMQELALETLKKLGGEVD